MAVSTNTLLVEGSFSELADELAQYLDTISKVESDSGIAADIEPLLNQIREVEAEETADLASVQKQKDDVLKKIVTKATILNNAPDRGRPSRVRVRAITDCLRIYCRLQPIDQPVYTVTHS